MNNNIKKIAYIKYFHVSNLGDDLLAISFIQNSNFDEYFLIKDKQYSPLNSFTSFRTVVKNVEKKVKVISSAEFKNISPNKNKFIVTIGGSVWPEEKIESKLTQYKKQKEKGWNIFFIGSNFPKLKNETLYKESLRILKFTNFFSVRDSFSSNKLSDSDKLFYGDPVYSLKLKESFDLNYCDSKPLSDRDFMVINLSLTFPNEIFNHDYSIDEQMNNVFNILNEKFQENYQEIHLKLLSFHDSRDLEILSKMRNKLREKCNFIKNIEIIPYNGDIKKIISVIRESDFSIATRFHHIVLNLIFDVSFLPIIYAQKNINHLHDIGKEVDVFSKANQQRVSEIKKTSRIQFDILNSIISES